jgi:hypothetical protein
MAAIIMFLETRSLSAFDRIDTPGRSTGDERTPAPIRFHETIPLVE